MESVSQGKSRTVSITAGMESLVNLFSDRSLNEGCVGKCEMSSVLGMMNSENGQLSSLLS